LTAPRMRRRAEVEQLLCDLEAEPLLKSESVNCVLPLLRWLLRLDRGSPGDQCDDVAQALDQEEVHRG
jgi:hypothetical protein